MMKTTIHEEIVQGIILKRSPYKENDMILHIYTKDYGKIGVMARGVRKLTSKNARACQDMMISEMSINLKKGLSPLIRATPIDYLRHIKEHLESEIVANYILEYYYRYVEENNPLEEEYQMLYDSLKALDHGYAPLQVYLLFQVFILKHNGVTLEVDQCVVCGNHQVVTISLSDGGFLCQEHYRNQPLYDPLLLKMFRHIHKIPIQKIDELHLDETICHQLIPIMDAFVEEYTGISLKTSTFIQQIV